MACYHTFQIPAKTMSADELANHVRSFARHSGLIELESDMIAFRNNAPHITPDFDAPMCTLHSIRRLGRVGGGQTR